LLAELSPNDRSLWATAVNAGLRRGELRALRWHDVDAAAGVIHVRRGWDAVEGEIEPKSDKGTRDSSGILLPTWTSAPEYVPYEHAVDS
jgi:integrase